MSQHSVILARLDQSSGLCDFLGNNRTTPVVTDDQSETQPKGLQMLRKPSGPCGLQVRVQCTFVKKWRFSSCSQLLVNVCYSKLLIFAHVSTDSNIATAC